MESISLVKSDDPDGAGNGFVYNIEVDGLHTYVANGVTVHNCHHVLTDNKWGAAANMFPNAKGLGVTATPVRADGKGLGRHADGLFDVMVEGPAMRHLIDSGYLTDYIIYAPETNLGLTGQDVSATTGDYKQPRMRAAAKKSTIVGDTVQNYLKFAPGKLGVTFATDVETATDIAKRFNAAGVPAEVVSAKTPDEERVRTLRRFRNRELLMLVNVDLFGEGFDLPAIEVVIMARPTQSFSLFAQQAGRMLRLMIDALYAQDWDAYDDATRRAIIANSNKPRAILIDQVGNVARHATVVDDGADLRIELVHRVWTLDRRDRRKSGGADDAQPITTCLKCFRDYPRAKPRCPYCEHKPEPASRSGPEQVDGDLLELDPVALASIRGAIRAVDMTAEEKAIELASKRAPLIGQRAGINRHLERQGAINALRDSIAWWAAWQRAAGKEDSESYRRFYLTFGTDVLTAQTLKRPEAEALKAKIDDYLTTRY